MAEKIKKTDFTNFERIYTAMMAETDRDRADAVGILRPDTLTTKKINQLARAQKNLVLAYGRRGEIREYTPDQLRQFLAAKQTVETAFKSEQRGVLLRDLENASSLVDKQRAKGIRNATLYKIQSNILWFRVTATGTTPNVTHHGVSIRLEDWTRSMHSGANPIMGARAAATGRISFDCTCGRHQYWYRYLATMGGFALNTAEHGFPKIRNSPLNGCCCKHVLKVLHTLKSGTLHLLLAKEMQKQSEKTDSSFGKKGVPRILSKNDLQQASTAQVTRGDTKNAWAARKKILHMQTVAEKNKSKVAELAPQGRKLPPISKGMKTVLLYTVRGALAEGKKENTTYNLNKSLDLIAKNMNISRSAIDELIKKEGLA